MVLPLSQLMNWLVGSTLVFLGPLTIVNVWLLPVLFYCSSSHDSTKRCLCLSSSTCFLLNTWKQKSHSCWWIWSVTPINADDVFDRLLVPRVRCPMWPGSKQSFRFRGNFVSSKMAHSGKPLAAKPEDLSLFPGAHTVEIENQLLKVVFSPPYTRHDLHIHHFSLNK